MDGDPGEVRQNPAGIDRVLPPARSQVIQGQRLRAGHMDPLQLARDPTPGLVEMRHLRTLEPRAGGGEETGQLAGCCGNSDASHPVDTGAPKQSAIISAARSTGRC